MQVIEAQGLRRGDSILADNQSSKEVMKVRSSPIVKGTGEIVQVTEINFADGTRMITEPTTLIRVDRSSKEHEMFSSHNRFGSDPDA